MADFSVAPYFDDYNEDKKFLKILVRPGYAIQARELNQMQSIIQNQIERFGKNIFKEGSLVIPGAMSVDTNIKYVKIQQLYNSTNVEDYLADLVGSIVTGSATSVKAKVVAVVNHTMSDSPVLMVKYVDSGTSTTKEFINSEVLTSDTTTISGITRVVKVNDTGTVSGNGSVAHVNKGVYFVRGQFVLASDQTIILDKFGNTPSYRIGFDVIEDVVVPEVDASLLDNANGESNYAAPGAHRYTINLVLNTRIIDAADFGNFTEILRIINGSTQKDATVSDYNQIEKALAQRTYDESGDYTLTPFRFQIREHRNNDRGQWLTATAYLIGDIVTNSGYTFVALSAGTSGATAPVSLTTTNNDGVVTWVYNATPAYNRGIFTPALGGDEANYAIGIDPGKAYVQGHVIEKSGTEFITVPKARTFEQVTRDIVPTQLGDYVLVTNMNGIPETSKFGAVDLYDQQTTTVGTASGTKIGTANIRAIEYESGTVGTQAAVYRMYVFNVVMNAGSSFGRDVKQFYYNAGTAPLSLTADIAFNLITATQISGSITASTTTVTGIGTLFLSQLKVKDVIVGNGTYGRVTAIASDTSLTIASASMTATNVVPYRLEAGTPENIANTSLLYPLAKSYIKTVRGAGGAYNTGYYVSQRFEATSNGSGVLTFNLAGTTDTTTAGSEFSYADTRKTIAINKTTGVIALPSSVTGSTTSMTISGLSATTPYCVYTPVYKSGANAIEKTKTKVSNATIDFTTAALASVQTLFLGKADVIRVSKIEMCTAFGAYNATGAVTVTNLFTLNNGQTESAYNQSSVIRTAGAPIPTGTIRVTFDYFNHSAGDYFSVDSYSSIRYEDIPVAKDAYNNDVRLSDVLDFRPRVADGLTTFTGTGSSLSQYPKFSFDTICDYSYYMGRADKISVNIYGSYIDLIGVPSLSPVVPADMSTGMTVASVNIPPYGLDVGLVNAVAVDNKRYTMRDIGRIDKRVSNLEYYTALSLLESETNNLKIVDEFGLDRYKNGFLTDSFRGQGVGDTASPDYKCSIDMQNSLMRPAYNMDNVNLIEKNTQDSQRVTAGYRVTGELVTLPYTDVALIKQPYATRTQNVTPYMVFTFAGTIKINPSTDEWFDIIRRPDIVNNVEGNFEAVRRSLTASGAITTVWGGWVNGSSSVTSEQVVTSRHGPTPNGWGTLVTTTTNQVRTGVSTTLNAVRADTTVSDNVVVSSVIPFIRSRTVKFVGKGLKASTNIYCLFENANVGAYVTPASVIGATAIVSKSSVFDTTTKVGSDVEAAQRSTAIGIDTAFDEGDVIYVSKRGGTSYASAGVSVGTAVLAYQENLTGDVKTYLHILNTKGTFVVGDEIKGTLSGANVTITTYTVSTGIGGTMRTTAGGAIAGTFAIPNSDAMHFRTGDKVLMLSDVATTNQLSSTTIASTIYAATGYLNTMQRTVNSVRNGVIATNVVSEARTLSTSAMQAQGDPLAQTFTVNSLGGCFVTKIDVYFATKDNVLPVKVEIREVVNGYPGNKVLPFSNVTIMPSEITLDPTLGATPTTIAFASPVYLNDQTQYCVVLLSDSTNYNVWISQLGDQEMGTTRYVSTQPTLGSLFKSQNNTTWTPDQTQDLKFTLYRAQFSLTAGTVNLVNQALPVEVLPANPFKTVSGSNIVRVNHYHHGIPSGKSVVLAGSVANQNGIPFAQLNGTFVISNVTLDSYTITVASNATVTGLCGGTVVSASYDIQYDVINPTINIQDFQDTDISFTVSGYTGKTVGGTETPYLNTIGANLTVNNDNILPVPGIVASTVNAPLDGLSNPIKTLSVVGSIRTYNDALSPVIDLGRTSAILVNNRVYQSNATDNVAVIDYATVIAGATDIAFAGKQITATVAGTKAAFLTVPSGTVITVSGSASNNGSFTVTSVASDGSAINVSATLVNTGAGAAITIVSGNNYISELGTVGGTTASRYLTKRVDFLNTSTFLKVMFATNCPPDADIDVYYKLLPVGSNTPMEQIPYVSAVGSYSITKTLTNGKYVDVTFDTLNNSSFISAVVKLVLRSKSSAKVPVVKDLRIIACA